MDNQNNPQPEPQTPIQPTTPTLNNQQSNQPTAFQPQPTYPPTNTTQIPAADPGKTLATVGFIMSFIFLAPIGLILSIIGFKKSKKAGYKNVLGIVGIILNGLALISGTVIIALILLTASSYNVVLDSAGAANSRANANAVKSFAEVYYAENSEYPDQISNFKENVGGQISLPSNITVTSNKNSMKDSYTIYYQFEGDYSDSTGGRVGYYDTEGIQYLYTGYADENSSFNNLK